MMYTTAMHFYHFLLGKIKRGVSTLLGRTYRLFYLRNENPKILLVIVDNIFYG